MPKLIDLDKTDACPKRKDFRFEHGVDLRSLRSQLYELEAVIEKSDADTTDLECLADLVRAMLSQHIVIEESP